jgi:membrane protein YqaA with SNARE-associated domain
MENVAAPVTAPLEESAEALTTSWRELLAAARTRWRSILVMLGVVAISIGIVSLPINYSAMGEYGYAGIFVVTLVSTMSLVLPVPYLAAIFVAGSFLNPAIVALVAGVAAAIGELTGYALGYSGRTLLPRSRWYRAIRKGMDRYGAIVIFIAAVIPNPFFDAVGMVAGATRLSIPVFLLSTFLGKALRFWLVATLGDTFMAS